MEVGFSTSRGDLPAEAAIGGGDEPDRLRQIDPDARMAGGVEGAVGPDSEAHQVDDRPVLAQLALDMTEEPFVGGQQ